MTGRIRAVLFDFDHTLGVDNRLEERARHDGRLDLARLLRGALLHTEADLKWMDELTSERFGAEGGKTN